MDVEFPPNMNVLMLRSNHKFLFNLLGSIIDFLTLVILAEIGASHTLKTTSQNPRISIKTRMKSVVLDI